MKVYIVCEKTNDDLDYSLTTEIKKAFISKDIANNYANKKNKEEQEIVKHRNKCNCCDIEEDFQIEYDKYDSSQTLEFICNFIKNVKKPSCFVGNSAFNGDVSSAVLKLSEFFGEDYEIYELYDFMFKCGFCENSYYNKFGDRSYYKYYYVEEVDLEDLK